MKHFYLSPLPLSDTYSAFDPRPLLQPLPCLLYELTIFFTKNSVLKCLTVSSVLLYFQANPFLNSVTHPVLHATFFDDFLFFLCLCTSSLSIFCHCLPDWTYHPLRMHPSLCCTHAHLTLLSSPSSVPLHHPPFSLPYLCPLSSSLSGRPHRPRLASASPPSSISLLPGANAST